MRYGALILILLAFGFSKLKFEQRLTQEHRAAFFHGARLNLDMRQQIGQMGFLAALSGFRSLVADALWIEAHSAWEETQWGRMALLFENVTALQPRCIMFWEMSAWHMGYNASVAARENPKQPREALRIKAQREYFKLAEDFLLRGIENNPDRYNLYEHLAILYRDKFLDHEKAFEWFDKAKDFKGAPVYEKRFAAYELSHCPGRGHEAYERLVALYKIGEQERLPTLLTRLKFLEEKLNVPPGQRVYTQPGKN
jgi:tetratricopeptide (TPR) repeat protein